MDWSLVERLAPSLAWPIVALIALPFAIWRINALVRALDQAQNLSSGLRGIIDLSAQINELTSNTKRLREEVEIIRTAQIAGTKERIAEESGTENEATSILDETTNSLTGSEMRDDNLYSSVSSEWRNVLEALNSAYARLRMGTPDRRSVGSAAVELTDRRRRNPLAPEDAEALAELHGLYKRYARLRRELNPGVLDEFSARSRELVARLDAVGS